MALRTYFESERSSMSCRCRYFFFVLLSDVGVVHVMIKILVGTLSKDTLQHAEVWQRATNFSTAVGCQLVGVSWGFQTKFHVLTLCAARVPTS